MNACGAFLDALKHGQSGVYWGDPRIERNPGNIPAAGRVHEDRDALLRETLEITRMYRIVKKSLRYLMRHLAKTRYVIARGLYEMAFVARSSPDRGQILFDAGIDGEAILVYDGEWDEVIALQSRLGYRRVYSTGEGRADSDNTRIGNKGTICVTGHPRSNDEWHVFLLNPTRYRLYDFEWELSFCKKTSFRELQFDFRFHDLNNRYRFRFENNKVYFEKILGGQFEHDVSSIDYPVQLGLWYGMRIIAQGFRFQLLVNDICVMTEYAFDRKLCEGTLAIILWETDGVTPIQIALGRSTVYALGQ